MSSFSLHHRMSSPSTTPTREYVLDRSLIIRRLTYKMKKCMFWGVVNLFLFVVFLHDVLYKCPYFKTTWYYSQWFLVVVFALLGIYNLILYFWHRFKIEPLVLNSRQKQLLGIKDSDPYFQVTSTPKVGSNPVLEEDITLLNFSAPSWRTSSLLSSNDSLSSPNFSMSSSSWLYNRGVSSLNNTSNVLKSPPTPSPMLDFPDRPDEESLNLYLQEYDKYEKSASVVQGIEQPTNLLSSFWSHSAVRASSDGSHLLQRSSYQHASPQPVVKSSSPGTSDEKGLPSFHELEVWLRVRVNPAVLTQWNANLRKWLSQTILERLVKEIELIDESFQRHGLSDMSVGGIGLERLMKTAQTPHAHQNIPSLMRLIPFLEISSNQEYLVSRIKELARGGCISNFQWNGGGNFNGKPWEDHLPTDSTVVMHLFTTYLDSQLPPIPLSPDGRPFTFLHFVKCPEKPVSGRHTIAIHQTQIFPPHYVVVSGDETLDVGKGHNNMFYTILLFLHLVNRKEHGMLGGVNLGRSGLNLLWVVQS